MGRPWLVDSTVALGGGVGAEGAGHHERPDPCLRRRLEDPEAAAHVDPVEPDLVVRGLNHPHQVHDHVGAPEQRPEVVAGDVRRPPFHLGHRQGGEAPGDAHHRFDGRLGDQRLDDARADVAGGAGHRDAHDPTLAPAVVVKELTRGAAEGVP